MHAGPAAIGGQAVDDEGERLLREVALGVAVRLGRFDSAVVE
jgi:hypothetical protein